MHPELRKHLAIWLLCIAACVWGMVVIGGLTRLTESGLSIVEWKPFTGTLPPLSHTEWQAEFADYKTSPQYHKINKGMSLEQFKGIFWLEYLHRLAGRAIGFVFLLPFLYFTFRHTLPGWLKWRLGGIFLLGGLQGAIGWYMVKSGLVNEPTVSPYRLALHLGTAFLLLGLLIGTALEVLSTQYLAPRKAWWLPGAILFQVILGALVAGLDAGLTYNTFPLMDGRFVPQGLYTLEPWWRNHFENVTMVQFQHRIGAYALTLAVFLFAFSAWRQGISSGLKHKIMIMMAVLALQIALGVLTLIHVVPIVLASQHQAVAALLFALSIWIVYDLHRERRIYHDF